MLQGWHLQWQSTRVKGSSLEILDWIWVFSHEQLYVGFSRCTSGNRLKVLLKNWRWWKNSNIVDKILSQHSYFILHEKNNNIETFNLTKIYKPTKIRFEIKWNKNKNYYPPEIRYKTKRNKQKYKNYYPPDIRYTLGLCPSTGREAPKAKLVYNICD